MQLELEIHAVELMLQNKIHHFGRLYLSENGAEINVAFIGKVILFYDFKCFFKIIVTACHELDSIILCEPVIIGHKHMLLHAAEGSL